MRIIFFVVFYIVAYAAKIADGGDTTTKMLGNSMKQFIKQKSRTAEMSIDDEMARTTNRYNRQLLSVTGVNDWSKSRKMLTSNLRRGKQNLRKSRTSARNSDDKILQRQSDFENDDDGDKEDVYMTRSEKRLIWEDQESIIDKPLNVNFTKSSIIAREAVNNRSLMVDRPSQTRSNSMNLSKKYLLIPISKDLYILNNVRNSSRTDRKLVSTPRKLIERNKNNVTSDIVAFKAHMHRNVKGIGLNRHLSDHNANYLSSHLDSRVSEKGDATLAVNSTPLYPDFLYPRIAFQTRPNVINIPEQSDEYLTLYDYENVSSTDRNVNVDSNTAINSKDLILSPITMPDYDEMSFARNANNRRSSTLLPATKLNDISQFQSGSWNHKNSLRYDEFDIEMTTTDFQSIFGTFDDNIDASVSLENVGMYSTEDDKEIFHLPQTARDNSKFLMKKYEDKNTMDFVTDTISTRYVPSFVSVNTYSFVDDTESTSDNQNINENSREPKTASVYNETSFLDDFTYDNRFTDKMLFDSTTKSGSLFYYEKDTTPALSSSDNSKWSSKKSNVENPRSLLMAIKPLSSELQKLLNAVKLVNQSIKNVQNRLCNENSEAARVERDNKERRTTNILELSNNMNHYNNALFRKRLNNRSWRKKRIKTKVINQAINDMKFRNKLNSSLFLNKLRKHLPKQRRFASNSKIDGSSRNFHKKRKINARKSHYLNNVKKQRLPYLRFNRNLKSLARNHEMQATSIRQFVALRKIHTTTPIVTLPYLVVNKPRKDSLNGRVHTRRNNDKPILLSRSAPFVDMPNKDNRSYFLLNNKRDSALHNAKRAMLENTQDSDEEKQYSTVDPRLQKEITAYMNILEMLRTRDFVLQTTQNITELLFISTTAEFPVTTFPPYFIEEPTTALSTTTKREEFLEVTESTLYEYASHENITSWYGYTETFTSTISAILTVEITVEGTITALTVATQVEVTEVSITIPIIEEFTTESMILLTPVLEGMTDITLKITIPLVTETLIEETVGTVKEIVESTLSTMEITSSLFTSTSSYGFSMTPVFTTSETEWIPITTVSIPILTPLITTITPERERIPITTVSIPILTPLLTTMRSTTAISTEKTISVTQTPIAVIVSPTVLTTKSTEIEKEMEHVTLFTTQSLTFSTRGPTHVTTSVEKISEYTATVTITSTVKFPTTTESTIITSTVATPTTVSEITTHIITTITSLPKTSKQPKTTLISSTDTSITTLTPEEKSPITLIENTTTVEEITSTETSPTTEIPTTKLLTAETTAKPVPSTLTIKTSTVTKPTTVGKTTTTTGIPLIENTTTVEEITSTETSPTTETTKILTAETIIKAVSFTETLTTSTVVKPTTIEKATTTTGTPLMENTTTVEEITSTETLLTTKISTPKIVTTETITKAVPFTETLTTSTVIKSTTIGKAITTTGTSLIENTTIVEEITSTETLPTTEIPTTKILTTETIIKTVPFTETLTTSTVIKPTTIKKTTIRKTTTTETPTGTVTSAKTPSNNITTEETETSSTQTSISITISTTTPPTFIKTSRATTSSLITETTIMSKTPTSPETTETSIETLTSPGTTLTTIKTSTPVVTVTKLPTTLESIIISETIISTEILTTKIPTVIEKSTTTISTTTETTITTETSTQTFLPASTTITAIRERTTVPTTLLLTSTLSSLIRNITLSETPCTTFSTTTEELPISTTISTIETTISEEISATVGVTTVAFTTITEELIEEITNFTSTPVSEGILTSENVTLTSTERSIFVTETNITSTPTISVTSTILTQTVTETSLITSTESLATTERPEGVITTTFTPFSSSLITTESLTTMPESTFILPKTTSMTEKFTTVSTTESVTETNITSTPTISATSTILTQKVTETSLIISTESLGTTEKPKGITSTTFFSSLIMTESPATTPENISMLLRTTLMTEEFTTVSTTESVPIVTETSVTSMPTISVISTILTHKVTETSLITSTESLATTEKRKVITMTFTPFFSFLITTESPAITPETIPMLLRTTLATEEFTTVTESITESVPISYTTESSSTIFTETTVRLTISTSAAITKKVAEAETEYYVAKGPMYEEEYEEYDTEIPTDRWYDYEMYEITEKKETRVTPSTIKYTKLPEITSTFEETTTSPYKTETPELTVSPSETFTLPATMSILPYTYTEEEYTSAITETSTIVENFTTIKVEIESVTVTATEESTTIGITFGSTEEYTLPSSTIFEIKTKPLPLEYPTVPPEYTETESTSEVSTKKWRKIILPTFSTVPEEVSTETKKIMISERETEITGKTLTSVFVSSLLTTLSEKEVIEERTITTMFSEMETAIETGYVVTTWATMITKEETVPYVTPFIEKTEFEFTTSKAADREQQKKQYLQQLEYFKKREKELAEKEERLKDRERQWEREKEERKKMFREKEAKRTTGVISTTASYTATEIKITSIFVATAITTLRSGLTEVTAYTKETETVTEGTMTYITEEITTALYITEESTLTTEETMSTITLYNISLFSIPTAIYYSTEEMHTTSYGTVYLSKPLLTSFTSIFTSITLIIEELTTSSTPYTIEEMYTTPYTIEEMYTTPYTTEKMYTTSYTTEEMYTTPYTIEEVYTTPYTIEEMYTTYTIKEMYITPYTTEEMYTTLYTTEEMYTTLYTTEEIYTTLYTIEELYITKVVYTTTYVPVYSELLFTSSITMITSPLIPSVGKCTVSSVTFSETFEESTVTLFTRSTMEEAYMYTEAYKDIYTTFPFILPTLIFTATTSVGSTTETSTTTEMRYDKEIEHLKEKLRKKERELAERERILLEREERLKKDIREFEKYMKEFEKKEMEAMLIALLTQPTASTSFSTPVPPTERITKAEVTTQVKKITEKTDKRITTKIIPRDRTTKLTTVAEKEKTEYIFESTVTQKEKEIATKRICLNVLENTTIPVDKTRRDIVTKKVCLSYFPEKNEEKLSFGRVNRKLLAFQSKEAEKSQWSYSSGFRYRRKSRTSAVTHKINNLQLFHHEWLSNETTRPLQHFKGFTRVYKKLRKSFLRNNITNRQQNIADYSHRTSLYERCVLDRHESFIQPTTSMLNAKAHRKTNAFFERDLIPENINFFNDKAGVEKKNDLSTEENIRPLSVENNTGNGLKHESTTSLNEENKPNENEKGSFTVNVLHLGYNEDEETHELISVKPSQDELTAIISESYDDYVTDANDLEEHNKLFDTDKKSHQEEENDYVEDMVKNYINYEEKPPTHEEKFSHPRGDEDKIATEFSSQVWPTERSTTYHLGGTRFWTLDFEITEPPVAFSATTKSKPVDMLAIKTTCLHVIINTERNSHVEIKRNAYNNETWKYNSLVERDVSFPNLIRRTSKRPSAIINELSVKTRKLYETKHHEQDFKGKKLGRHNELSPISIIDDEDSAMAKSRKLCGVNENKSKRQIVKHKEDAAKIAQNNKKKQPATQQSVNSSKVCTNSCVTIKKKSNHHKTMTVKTTANRSQMQTTGNRKHVAKVTHPDNIANRNNKSKSVSHGGEIHYCSDCICDVANVIDNIKSILDKVSFPLDEIRTLNCSRYKDTRQDKIVISVDSKMDEIKEFPQLHYNTESLKGQKYVKLDELENNFKNDFEFTNDRDIFSLPGLNLNLPCNQEGDSITWLSSISRPRYTWRRTDGIALFGFVSENGDLELRNVNAKDTGNYTCVMTYMSPDNEEPVETTYEVHLQIIMLPRYTVHGENRYHTRSCDERDLDVLVTYLPSKLNSIICETDICNAYVLTPSCSRNQIAVNVLLVPSRIVKLMTVDPKHCNVFCLKAIQDKISLMLSRNLQIFLGKTNCLITSRGWCRSPKNCHLEDGREERPVRTHSTEDPAISACSRVARLVTVFAVHIVFLATRALTARTGYRTAKSVRLVRISRITVPEFVARAPIHSRKAALTCYGILSPPL